MANYNEQYSRKSNIKIIDILEEDTESEEKLTEKPILVILKNNNSKLRVMRKRNN